VRRRCRPTQHGPDPRQQLLVVERLGQEIVAATVECPYAVDRVRLGLAEDDDRHVAVTFPARVQRLRVPEKHEIGPRAVAHDLEAVILQMTLEKPVSRVGARRATPSTCERT
jgi:hypothetical protein